MIGFEIDIIINPVDRRKERVQANFNISIDFLPLIRHLDIFKKVSGQEAVREYAKKMRARRPRPYLEQK